MASDAKIQSPAALPVAIELRLAKAYWLDTIQPHIAGRRLKGVELFIANRAHWSLQAAATKAKEWNATKEGKLLPVPIEEFREPEALFAEDYLKPELLASIASSLLPKPDCQRSPTDAVRLAHDLLYTSQEYIKGLPKQNSDIESLANDFALLSSNVPFEEILRSNKKDSGQLPLLPPKQKDRNKGELSLPAIKDAVKDFWEWEKKNRPQIKEEQWNRGTEQDQRLAKEGKLIMLGTGKPMSYQEWQRLPDETLSECLQHNRIPLSALYEMRWQRFKSFWEDQQLRGLTKKRKSPKKSESKKAKAKTPVSAGSSPQIAGKLKS